MIMYRARAEAVSGTRVYADGKWLQCIGNKRVSVGDRIWTDGRCVYGHFQESQQPLIPTPIEDEGIPILIREGNTYKFYTVDKKKPKSLMAPENFDNEKLWASINKKKKNAYISEIKRRRKSFETEGEFEHVITRIVSQCTLAVNVDKQGNIFELKKELTDVYPNGISTIKVYVIKNGQTLQEVNCEEQATNVSAEAKSLAISYTPGASRVNVTNHLNMNNYAPWGVIEDENNWAFINTVLSTYDAYGYGSSSDDNQVIFPLVPTNTSIIWGSNSFLYTPKGKTEICSLHSGWTRIINFGLDTYTYHYSFKASLTANKIPIQDGFYFTINSIKGSEAPGIKSHVYAYPRFMNASIFSPQNQLLFQGNFILGTYFTICQYKNSILLGIDDRENYGLIDRDFYSANKYDIENDVGNGIFLLQNQKLTLLAEGNVRNWKLRPMKKIRGWQNRLQSIELEQHEI